MFFLFIRLSCLILFLDFGTGALADVTPNYARIFEDRRLDVTIALGFDEASERRSEIPFLGPLIDGLGYYRPANRNAHYRNIADFEHEISDCRECRFTLDYREPGYRLYRTHIDDTAGLIDVYLKILFWEKGISSSHLKELFARSCQTDDVIIYAGHSLFGEGFPNLGPGSRKQGLLFRNNGSGKWSGFSSRSFATDKYQILFLNACKTKAVYENPLRTLLPGKDRSNFELILTNDDPLFSDYPATTVALVKGIIRRESREKIWKNMESSALSYRAIHMNKNVSPLFHWD